MTPEQRRMARHALGLPNDRRRSYRNRYFSPAGTDQYSAWSDLVVRGLASREDATASSVCFCLTGNGALVALEPGERHDPEDFPTLAEART